MNVEEKKQPRYDDFSPEAIQRYNSAVEGFLEWLLKRYRGWRERRTRRR